VRAANLQMPGKPERCTVCARESLNYRLTKSAKLPQHLNAVAQKSDAIQLAHTSQFQARNANEDLRLNDESTFEQPAIICSECYARLVDPESQDLNDSPLKLNDGSEDEHEVQDELIDDVGGPVINIKQPGSSSPAQYFSLRDIEKEFKADIEESKAYYEE
jgi:hypothetical protein